MKSKIFMAMAAVLVLLLVACASQASLAESGVPNGDVNETEELSMGGLELWVAHGYQKLFLESECPAGASRAYTVYAAKNETEGVQIALRSASNTEGIRFRLSDLPNGVEAQVFQMYGVTKLHDVT